ncbi:hypothetical protein ESB00_04155 [Oleiharenicola lentus]|uniref:Uncharacterized protein n=1 Tax=Oleiharenicola lentus TaxID=2508720 RepID=A0A4V1M6E3_9BACT|nr:hypothetical protein [Oleiharenicola lentus]RXK55099.1 hypothetical protein ESB00_04155 [Oleiharenicola lentus]
MKVRLALLTILAGLLAACGRFEGTFSFLRDEPVKADVPGTFILDQSSQSGAMLRSMGYTDLSARITLKEDGTFSISQMPDCWLTDFADSKGGYDGCSGTWSIYKSYSVYTISLSVDRWVEGSTYVRDKKNSGFAYTAAFTLTKEKEGYGLALPLAAGDKGHVYFRREKRG